MSIKFNNSPSSRLTPSTIECTQFYTNASSPIALSSMKRYSSMYEMKKYLGKDGLVIQQWLPNRISVASTWSLLYSLDQHGASLNTLYRKCFNNGPCLLVIRDSQDEVFGAYLSEGVHIDTSCYGTGECFLWKQNKSTKQVDVYHWTMLNDYLIYGDQDFFAIGGGQGCFGLWLHSDLTHGYSQPCLTFNNPMLSKNPSFECIELEIWDFQF
ncbi:TLD-domain-containing protein [Parasitella parasitica]|nr:TLD-domain-containing protein [Parasitella parasitica]